MKNLLALLVSVAAALPAAAEVKVVTTPDGRKLIYNERTYGRERPAAVRRAAPAAQLEEVIATWARRHRLAVGLVEAVIEAESAYDPRARSHKGAMGLMQLMPETAVLLAVDDPYDPAANVRGGTAYLRQMLDRFGRLEPALAAYNAGPSAVERHGGVPPYPETREFVRRVLSLYRGSEQPLPEVGRGVGRRTPVWTRDASGRPLLTTEP